MATYPDPLIKLSMTHVVEHKVTFPFLHLLHPIPVLLLPQPVADVAIHQLNVQLDTLVWYLEIPRPPLIYIGNFQKSVLPSPCLLFWPQGPNWTSHTANMATVEQIPGNFRYKSWGTGGLIGP
jgi:hypothetical protein